MTETNTTPATTEKAPASSRVTTREDRASAEQRKIVYRLQDHIDENGRYNDALKPIALGYAAGKGISEYEARQEIDSHFKRDMGTSMKSYLEQHRIERGLDVDRNNNGRGGR